MIYLSGVRRPDGHLVGLGPSEFRMRQYKDDNHREYAPHFIMVLLIVSVQSVRYGYIDLTDVVDSLFYF